MELPELWFAEYKATRLVYAVPVLFLLLSLTLVSKEETGHLFVKCASEVLSPPATNNTPSLVYMAAQLTTSDLAHNLI